MDNYETQYEEYKQSLLRSSYFLDNLNEKKRNALYAEKDYIDRDGVLSKIGVLSAICGSCYALASSLVQLNEFPGIIVRTLFAIVGTICFLKAMSIGSQFKEDSGKKNFRYQYDRHIENRAMSDKELEARSLVRSFLSKEMDKEEFRKRCEDLSRYDRFASDLKNDYEFNTKIQNKI